MLYYQCLPEKTKSCQQCAQPESSSVWRRSSKRRQTLAEVNSATRDEGISGRIIQGQKGSFRSLWSELLHHSQQEDSQCFMHKMYGSLQKFLLHPFFMRRLPLFLWGEEYITSYYRLLQPVVSDLKLFAFISSFCLVLWDSSSPPPDHLAQVENVSQLLTWISLYINIELHTA